MAKYVACFDIKTLGGQLLRSGDVKAGSMNELVFNFSNVAHLLGISESIVNVRSLKWREERDAFYTERFNVQRLDLSIDYYFKKRQ